MSYLDLLQSGELPDRVETLDKGTRKFSSPSRGGIEPALNLFQGWGWGYFRMNKVSLGIIALLILAGIIIFASYRFSVKTHREVLEHRPSVPDIPGALFYDIYAAGSDEGKAFIEYMKGETRHVEMPAFHMDITLNSLQYFRLLARAESNRSSDYHRRGMLIFKGPSPMRDTRLVFKDPSGYGKDKILEWKR